jgi:hypothetical protein
MLHTFSENVFKKPQHSSKCLTLLKKASIKASLNFLKKLRILEKPNISLKKTSILLKMYIKILALIKKASVSLEISSKRIESFKKASNQFKKATRS